MKLPSSSSLLLATLASSSSLSALAAPTGDCPDDSSSTAPAPLNHDGTAIQSNGESISCTTATFPPDIVTDNLQSRGLVDDLLKALPPPAGPLIEGILLGLYSGKDKTYPKARADSALPVDGVIGKVGDLTGIDAGRKAARAEERGETDSPEDSSPPAAANPDGSAQSPGTPAAPSPPSPPSPPVKPPVPLPQLPGVKAPFGRRDASDAAALMSPPPPRNPPNTPVQRGLSSIDPELPI